ncbi:MAG TPA: hypothetical protein VL463_09325, partial [Kofleriaceae bacterium]|nr:hypothetical protein [Kofleriaceae bacterium]
MRSITSCVSCVLLGCAGSPASHTAIDAGATGALDAPPFDVPDGGCAETPAWTGHDDVAPSQAPPAGLAREQVPQFVSFGFDDNFRSDAILWILDDLIKGKTNPPGAHDACTSDGTPVHASFYLSTTYITTDGATEDEGAVRAAWRREYTDGNEMADHTHLHADGTNFSVDQWKAEMQTCIQWLTDPSKGVGVHAEEIIGFRTPFLLYSDKTYVALHDL